jgi:hypothetical protein
MENMNQVTFNMPESLHDRLVLFVESEYQKHNGEFSRELIMEYILCKSVAVIGKYIEDFPPEQTYDLLH